MIKFMFCVTFVDEVYVEGINSSESGFKGGELQG